MDDLICELWQILNSDEAGESRVEQAKDLISDWADENHLDLPEILEFDVGEEDES